MGKRIVGSIIGLGMMALAVGAFLSNEPASKTDEGHIFIIVVFLMGLVMFLNNLSAKKPAPVIAVPPAPIVPSAPLMPVSPLCPNCHKPVAADFTICPYCATVLKSKCPACGKEVAPDFKNCPYCGVQLPNH